MATFPWSPNMQPTQGPGWQETLLRAETIADVENSAAPSTGPVSLLVTGAGGATYEFTPGDTTAPDTGAAQRLVLGTNGQGPVGRWRLKGFDDRILNGAPPAGQGVLDMLRRVPASGSLWSIWAPGDSLNWEGYGQTPSHGWHPHFARRMESERADWREVGTQTFHDFGSGSALFGGGLMPDEYGPSDWEHEGHGGYSIGTSAGDAGTLWGSMATWLTSLSVRGITPDVVIDSSGTNANGDSAATILSTRKPGYWAAIRAALPNALIVVTTSPPVGTVKSHIAALNAGMAAAVAAFNDPRVIYCDTASDFTPAETDGTPGTEDTHPNAWGYAKWGHRLADCILARLPTPRGDARVVRPIHFGEVTGAFAPLDQGLVLWNDTDKAEAVCPALDIGSDRFALTLEVTPIALERPRASGTAYYRTILTCGSDGGVANYLSLRVNGDRLNVYLGGVGYIGQDLPGVFVRDGERVRIGVYGSPADGVLMVTANGRIVGLYKGLAAWTFTTGLKFTLGYNSGLSSSPAFPCVIRDLRFHRAMSPVEGFGTAPPVMTVTGTPTTAITSLRVEVVAVGTGALGNTTIRYSLDGGTTWVATVTTGATIVLTGSGLTAHLSAGPYSADNVWTAQLGLPAYAPGVVRRLFQAAHASGAPLPGTSAWFKCADAQGSTTLADSLNGTALTITGAKLGQTARRLIVTSDEVWTPDLMPSSLRRMDIDPARGMQLNGAAVAQANDQSGNAFDFIQATGANQPAWVANGLGGVLPVIRLDGAASKMQTTATFAQLLADPGKFHVFCVMVGRGFSARVGADWYSKDPFFSVLDSRWVPCAAEGVAAGGPAYGAMIYDGGLRNTAATPAVVGEAHLMATHQDTGVGNTLYTRLDNTAEVSCVASASIAIGALRLGVDDTGTHYAQQDIARLIVCGATLTGLELRQMNAYLSAKYGTPRVP